MELVIVWIVSMVLGCLIGSSKGQSTSGFVWTFLLGPLGVLIVLCLPNLVKQAADEERSKQERAKIRLQEQQLEETKRQNQSGRPIPAPPGGAPSFRIAKDGEDLGNVALPAIKLMLAGGTLSANDYYLDPQRNEWRALNDLAGIG